MGKMREVTSEEVENLLHRYLDEAFPNEAERPFVLADRIAVDGDWWTVPVTSPLENSDRFHYYGRLAEVETKILRTERVDIELIPATPSLVA